MTPLKKCTKCGEEKPATKEFFWKNPRSKDGLQYKCKQCETKRVTEYDKRNPEKKRQRNKNVNRTKRKSSWKRWLDKNKVKRAALARDKWKELSHGTVRRYIKYLHHITPTDELIELKRIHITLKRNQNERKNKQSVNP